MNIYLLLEKGYHLELELLELLDNYSIQKYQSLISTLQ